MNNSSIGAKKTSEKVKVQPKRAEHKKSNRGLDLIYIGCANK